MHHEARKARNTGNEMPCFLLTKPCGDSMGTGIFYLDLPSFTIKNQANVGKYTDIYIGSYGKRLKESESKWSKARS